MRLLGILVIAAVMYFAVPLLWQRAMVHKVQEISATSQPPIVEPIAIQPVDPALMQNAINPPVVINTDEYEAIALQSQTDEAIRRSEQMQDQAAHGYDPGRD